MAGKFITLEGGEGVGKTTNIQFIEEYLQRQNIPVVVTREPGGTPVAETLRKILLANHEETISGQTELLLMFAARSQHLSEVIWPHLTKGTWVLCDRFTDATYAYQGGGRKVDFDKIACLENLVQGDFRPDLTLLLDAPVEVGLNRAEARNVLDRFELEKLDFFQSVRETYLDRAQQYPERIKIILADQALGQVQKQIVEQLENIVDDNG
jgi:dTMP kinase